MRAVKTGMSLISKDLYGKTRRAIIIVIQGIGVSVTQVEVSRDVAGGLGSKSKNWELVVRGASKLGWLKKV